MPSSQRPFFLSSFLAAFRQQAPPALSATSQPNKHTGQPSSSPSTSGARSISSTSQSQSPSQQPQQQRTGGVMNQIPLQSSPHRHQPHNSPQPHCSGIPIPGSGRRRGSDSSSEGFRDVLGADKWYIGGRTAGGDERFFKLGVVKRVRSQDRLSLDRLNANFGFTIYDAALRNEQSENSRLHYLDCLPTGHLDWDGKRIITQDNHLHGTCRKVGSRR
ncbi:hypothetical protein M426DRAFT_26435 [Hypoxylon sp. CI-4A]|nr:hypothetical protein M426DRAFT_26435 [Hypoxylon sp. CI-4A]